VALMMIDLDHFKSVNDAHGHAGGDAVLQAFVRTALTLMRGSDLFGRVGGEEFAALLPQTDLEGAAALAHRLGAQVQAQPVALASGPVAYTVSIGVAARAVTADDEVSVESLMLDADAALYRAKGEGRNRVLLAAPR
jgi:diguanylate cyclase (GGDEF)-like protein